MEDLLANPLAVPELTFSSCRTKSYNQLSWRPTVYAGVARNLEDLKETTRSADASDCHRTNVQVHVRRESSRVASFARAYRPKHSTWRSR